MSENKLKIIDIIKNRGQISANDLGSLLSIGQPMIHRYLKKLVEENVIKKTGTPPKVYYSITEERQKSRVSEYIHNLDKKIIDVIDENFTLLEPNGTEILGFPGFIKWCDDRNYKVTEKSKEYVNLLQEYENFKKDGFINATEKIKTSFKQNEIFLNELYYLYPYSLPVFGKTKIGQWLFYAKQTQDKKLMAKVMEIIIPKIEHFILIQKVGAIAFVPPTVPRNIQFMKELEKKIVINLPIIKIEKIKTPITIQQKGLKDIKDRIINAESTMLVSTRGQIYDRVLIIDDFTGSGATLNVIAEKIKKQNNVNTVIGLTITGSMNGFEVVREV